jgi:uncharacterized protein (DUF952 family)
MSEFIYHITKQSAWQDALQKGQYAPASLQEEGFIHCSSARQVVPVANAFFSNQTGLVLLEIDPTRLVHELKWQPGINKPAEKFPHLFGSLNLEAVKRVVEFIPGDDGLYKFPWSID